MSSSEVVVHIAQGEAEAQQVCAFLEAHGVRTIVLGETLGKYHGFVLDGLGELKIAVDKDQEEYALELLERVNSGELSIDAE